ncbi:hypothetical protein FE257_009983 [Aspergillus nanangensis]|uniref:Luciferase domain-containing protein n=1 Tax=Aspergillus nanangensis TaxID=2582783 RepID=A0AAD4CWL4_ASPNN|nr:hypothetical protein FE257_009983 [Aspergillus nanangensis]
MNKTLTLTAITVTLLAVTLPRVYNDYCIFMSYGPGGIPYNPLGWLAANVIIRPFAQEPFSTTVYEQKIQAGNTIGFLSDEKVAAHKRNRPVVGPHIVPHRQLTEFSEKDIRKVSSRTLSTSPGEAKLIEEFESFANRNPHLVKLAPSLTEMQTDGLFLVDEVGAQNPAARQMKNEVAHIHRLKDGSLHATMAPADCKKLFDGGWAQRHGLSGVDIPRILTGGRKISLPVEYVLIYAPRNEEELDFVMEVVAASVKYMAKEEKENGVGNS